VELFNRGNNETFEEDIAIMHRHWGWLIKWHLYGGMAFVVAMMVQDLNIVWLTWLLGFPFFLALCLDFFFIPIFCLWALIFWH